MGASVSLQAHGLCAEEGWLPHAEPRCSAMEGQQSWVREAEEQEVALLPFVVLKLKFKNL